MNRFIWMVLALLFFLLTPAAAQVKGPVTFSVDVPPGKWKAVRLRNLPKDAVVAVHVQASGEIAVAFVDTGDYRRFPAVARPLFAGRIEKQLSFPVRMPAARQYYVVFDNRSGGESLGLTVVIRAARAKQREETMDKLTTSRSWWLSSSWLS